MTVFSYLRVSSKNQVEGDGFDRQRSVIERRASSLNLTITREFKEEGISGTLEHTARPALTELITAAAECPTPPIVIVEKADRLARDLIISELLLQQFSQMGVKVIEAEGGNDLTAGDDDNPTAKLIRQILAAVSEFDKSSIVRKLKAARARKRASTGRCEGAKPFGTKPGEENTKVAMFIMHREGRSVRYIAEALNLSSGYPTRSGKPWTPGAVAKILARK